MKHLVDIVRRTEARLKAKGRLIAISNAQQGPNCLCNPQNPGLCPVCSG